MRIIPLILLVAIFFIWKPASAQEVLSPRDSMQLALAQELDNRGFGHYLRGEYDQALPYALKTNKIYRKLHLQDRTPLGQSYINLAIIYANLYKLDRASRHLEKGITLFEEIQKDHPYLVTAMDWRKKIELAREMKLGE